MTLIGDHCHYLYLHKNLFKNIILSPPVDRLTVEDGNDVTCAPHTHYTQCQVAES